MSKITIYFLVYLTFGCATNVTTNYVSNKKSSNPPNSISEIQVFGSIRDIDKPFHVVGQVNISDTGFSVGCGYDDMVLNVKNSVVAAKADAAFFTFINPPNMRSTCYQGQANIIIFTSNEFNSRSAPKNIEQSSGSAFLISSEGYVATNFHVVDGCSSFRLLNEKNPEGFNAEVVKNDAVNDLAILKINDSKFKKLPVSYGIRSSANVKLGENIFVMGYPLGAILGGDVKVTSGIVNSTSGIQGDSRIFQISAGVQPGNSGGPLFDMRGNVVGIVVATLSPSFVIKHTGSIPQNINFAIKVDYLNILAGSLGIRSLAVKNENLELHQSTEQVKSQVFKLICN